MKLYFQAGKNHRLAINTERKTWNTNYFYLGSHRSYIKISTADYKELLKEIDFNGWDYEEHFQ